MTQTRTYIRVTYVALTQWGKPIVTAHTEEDLKAGIDEYYGIGTDNKAKYIEWAPNNSKYPDELEGHHVYEVDDFNGGLEFEQVKVYCVDFYPHTKYEKQIQKEALIELTNINLENESIIKVDKECDCGGRIVKYDKFTEEKYCDDCGWWS